MADFILPKAGELLRHHTIWNDQAMTPYIDDLIDLWAQNNVYGTVDVCVQGPMMTRFGIIPADKRSATRISKLEPFYRKIFYRRDIRVYRADGHIYIDVPWRHDEVWLGDLLTSREYSSSEGIPLAIGMNLYRECVMAELTYSPNLLVGGTPGSGLSDFLQGLVLSILIRQLPGDVDLYLCSSSNLSFDDYAILPYCHVCGTVRETMAMLSEMSAEIDRRNDLLYESGCRDIYRFNERGGHMKHRIIMITEYQRLFRSNRQAAMAYILRISQLARPLGIHLILASAEPTCLRGLRESFPARVCMKVANPTGSKILLGETGGEKLIRKRSLYYLDGHDPDPQLLQCGYATAKEVRNVLNVLGSNYVNARKYSIFDEIDEEDSEDGSGGSDRGGIRSLFRN
ncbi:MAG TPA: hypothetical protein DCF49_03190 [Lachnospiraceae bacterium]|nr:hypothetical protein [Lachnospiraceae bacterium]